jgi:hypothetical protein
LDEKLLKNKNSKNNETFVPWQKLLGHLRVWIGGRDGGAHQVCVRPYVDNLLPDMGQHTSGSW